MGRPVILHERIPLAAAPAPPGTPSQVVRTDPTVITPPEAMKVNHIVMDTEIAGQAPGIRVRPMLVEREFWATTPTEIGSYNNLQRAILNDNSGTHWLAEPYLLRRGATINIKIQNRMVGLAATGMVMFHGYGIKSKRPYDLPIHWTIAAGTAAGVEQVFGGSGGGANISKISGREDVLITAVSWQRDIESEAWNVRLLAMQVQPSYGQQWMSKGGTARGAGGLLVPFYALSNVRGPAVECFFTPSRDLVLEQGDEISFEFQNQIQGAAATALLTVIGTSVAD